MSLFGKILAVFNVLAAIAFFSIGAMSYTQRQQWSYSHFRHQVALEGLPVANNDDTWRLAGRTIGGDLTTRTLEDMFRAVGGKPVRTQVDEVNRLQNEINAELQGAPDVNAQRAILSAYLIPLQTTGADREAVIAQLRNAKNAGDINALAQKLEDDFKAATSEATRPAPPVEQRRRELLDRRRAIADLLYNIRPTNDWHARVQTVVGLEQYVAAADRQAENLVRMTQRMRDGIADERTKFVKSYMSLLPELQRLGDDLKRYDAKLAELKNLINRHTALKNTRSAEVADLTRKIQEASQVVARETADLQALQQRLFAVQQELARAQSANQALERDIQAREAGK